MLTVFMQMPASLYGHSLFDIVPPLEHRPLRQGHIRLSILCLGNYIFISYCQNYNDKNIREINLSYLFTSHHGRISILIGVHEHARRSRPVTVEPPPARRSRSPGRIRLAGSGRNLEAPDFLIVLEDIYNRHVRFHLIPLPERYVMIRTGSAHIF